MNPKRLFSSLLAVGLLSTALLAAQPSWLDRLLSRDGEKTVAGAPAKPPVEPHPEVVSLQNSFAKVVDAVKPAVVNIAAVQIARADDRQPDEQEFYYGDPEEFFRRFFGEQQAPRRRADPEREYRSEATGSGVIIDPDGYILTNNHVVSGSSQLTVTLSDGKTYKGKVIGTDERTDLAIVRIKAPGALPFAVLGDSAQTKVGDWVLAFGSPFGLTQTVTAGIISAIRQSLNIEGKAFRNLLQTDAAINRGNSGGPLVNIRGEIVGINTAIYAPTGVFSGIGFAIPVNDAKLVLKDLMEKGYVERSWMGVEIADVDEVIAKQFGLDKVRGALVNQTVPNSPAAKAGVQRGDIITDFAKKKIGSVQELQDVVSATPPGRSVPVTVLRDGKSRDLTLKTATMPKPEALGGDEPDADNAPDEEAGGSEEFLGAKAVNLTDRVRNDYGVGDKSVSGVAIVDVPADSPAAEAGLMEGDVVRAINRTEVRSVKDLKKVAKSADAAKGLVLDVVRRGRSFYLSFKSLQ